MTRLELREVVKHYDAGELVRAVDGVSLAVAGGEVVGLCGPSGPASRRSCGWRPASSCRTAAPPARRPRSRVLSVRDGRSCCVVRSA